MMTGGRVNWLIADQIRPHDERIEVLKTGERIVVNHKLTVRKAYSIFYWTTNVGALSGLASTSLEKYIGFWASFLLSFISLSIGLVILLVGKKSFCELKLIVHLSTKLIKGRLSRATAKLPCQAPTCFGMRNQRWFLPRCSRTGKPAREIRTCRGMGQAVCR